MTMLAALLIGAAAFAQGQLVTWSSHVEKLDGDTYKVVFSGKVADGYHTYTLTDELSATEFMDVELTGCELSGKPYEVGTPVEEIDEWGDKVLYYYNEIVIAQDIKVTEAPAVFAGTIFTNSCTGGTCKSEYYDFEVKVGEADAADSAAPADSALRYAERAVQICEKNGIYGDVYALALLQHAQMMQAQMMLAFSGFGAKSAYSENCAASENCDFSEDSAADSAADSADEIKTMSALETAFSKASEASFESFGAGIDCYLAAESALSLIRARLAALRSQPSR